MLDMVWARMTTAYMELRDREEGQALVEYALILALIAVVSVAVLAAIGGKVNHTLVSVRNAI